MQDWLRSQQGLECQYRVRRKLRQSDAECASAMGTSAGGGRLTSTLHSRAMHSLPLALRDVRGRLAVALKHREAVSFRGSEAQLPVVNPKLQLLWRSSGVHGRIQEGLDRRRWANLLCGFLCRFLQRRTSARRDDFSRTWLASPNTRKDPKNLKAPSCASHAGS